MWSVGIIMFEVCWEHFFGERKCSHSIQVWYIYLYEWLISMVNVGKYTSPMDGKGGSPFLRV